jgi:peptide/nickel transport system substrate-binding protein
MGADAIALDPAIVTDGSSATVSALIYDTLVAYEGTSSKLVPWLSESWESTDSKVWTFKLREGVKFHDGSDLDASAVKFNFDRWRDKSNPNRYAGQVFEYYEQNFGEGAAGSIENVEAVDKSTVKFTLKEPSAIFPLKLTLFAFGIASPTAIEEQKEKFGTPAGTPVGTGRFKFTSWTQDDKIVVDRNDDWWGGKASLPYTQAPLLQQVIFRIIKDATVQKAEFEAGRVDAPSLTPDEVKALTDDDPNFAKYPGVPNSVGYVRFNQKDTPFAKKEVREAIAYGVNWDAIVKAFYAPTDMRAGGFQPPSIPGYNPDIKPREFNPDKAKELLKQAGYPDGFQVDFWYMPVVRGYMPDAKGMAEAISADLARIGVKTSLKTEDWAVYLEDRKLGKFPMYQAGWGSDNGDPDNFIAYHFLWADGKTPNAEDGYNNPKLQELLRVGAQEGDYEKRIKLYQQAEQIVHDDVALIPIGWPVGQAVQPRFIKNYRVLSFRDGYEFICIDRKR